ncbi:MAG: hypothetical protein AMXMBFR72_35650 [Betaproteobacteria bacterium]
MKRPTLVSQRWFRWNAAAWLIGYVLYTPIAHGVTGGHGRDLTTSQLLAHCVGLAVVAVIVAVAQRRALAPFVPVPWTRVPVAVAAFNIAFWIGYHQPFVIGPDTDILLGFLVLGSAVWPGTVPVKGHLLPAVIAVLSFPVASVVAELALIITFSVLQITPAMQTSELQHSIFWIVVGGVSGSLGGWVSGLALASMVPSGTVTSATQQALAADAAARRG